MRVFFHAELREGPWGGGNQFLKALRKQLRAAGHYAERADEADLVLFNAYPFRQERASFSALQRFRRRRPEVPLVHRVDGPVLHLRGFDRAVDTMIYDFNRLVADGTVFQSTWSRAANRELGMARNRHETVVINAPDPELFHPPKRRPARGKRVSIIASSWSANWRKGFEYYRFLDRHLDFDRYAMTFVGNSPVQFENIVHRPPVAGPELAEILRQHEIYIIGSAKDCCSNALLEGLHCGLPALALQSGAHAELVRDGGVLFRGEEDLLDAVERLAADLEAYRRRIDLPTLPQVAERYLAFFEEVAAEHRARPCKGFSRAALWYLLAKVQLRNQRARIKATAERLRARCGRALRGPG